MYILCINVLHKIQFHVHHISSRTVRHTTRIVGNNLTKKNSCQIPVELFMPSATILSKLCHHNYINYNAVIIVTAIWRGTRQTAACFNSFLRLAH